ncbi:hypothetical protein Prudu_154S000900 [Prunus dulcis]|uniref:Uncharacterized protein n=1 Tax=Prunus dulcis TaxID=3755 RepID=A0A5H2Y338_PRUDU|nr:hypothetical protein Prudu_154S000900 [Prunus dulcis]
MIMRNFDPKYEKHEAKKDPEHARRHRIEEEIGATGAVGSGGYAFHEHHEEKESKREEEDNIERAGNQT